MRKHYYILVLFALALSFEACKKDEPTKTDTDNTQTEFTTAYCVQHGKFYADKGVEAEVLSVDFYSQGISLDSLGYMSGTGTNLYFSDIFSLSNQLIEGLYTADTTAKQFTFLPGKNYEGMNFNGCYFLNLQDDEVQSIEIIEQGSFRVALDGTETEITFSFTRQSGEKYQGHYKGAIHYADN